MEATSRTSPLLLRLKSGKSLSSLLWWKTSISSLPWIWTVWIIPFEEYIFDTSLALFNLWQLKASWWSKLVKFSFTNILGFGIPNPDTYKNSEFLPIIQDLLTIFWIHQPPYGLSYVMAVLYIFMGNLNVSSFKYLTECSRFFPRDIVRNFL